MYKVDQLQLMVKQGAGNWQSSAGGEVGQKSRNLLQVPLIRRLEVFKLVICDSGNLSSLQFNLKAADSPFLVETCHVFWMWIAKPINKGCRLPSRCFDLVRVAAGHWVEYQSYISGNQPEDWKVFKLEASPDFGQNWKEELWGFPNISWNRLRDCVTNLLFLLNNF